MGVAFSGQFLSDLFLLTPVALELLPDCAKNFIDRIADGLTRFIGGEGLSGNGENDRCLFRAVEVMLTFSKGYPCVGDLLASLLQTVKLILNHFIPIR